MLTLFKAWMPKTHPTNIRPHIITENLLLGRDDITHTQGPTLDQEDLFHFLG